MATLYRRGKTWWAYTCSGTKRLRWSLETTDKRIARQKLRKIEYEQDTGELELPSHTPIDQFLQAFCEHLETIRSRKAYKNDLSYLRIFFGAVCEALKPGSTTNRRFAPQNPRPVKDQFARLHVRVGTLEELSPGMIDEFITRRIKQDGIANKTANRHREILHVMFNYAIRHHAFRSLKRGWEAIGFFGGYEGMLDPPKYRSLNYNELSGLLTRGGTILGTANRGRFSAKVGHGKSRSLPPELLEAVRSTMAKMNIRGLVSIGGDGSLSIAQQMFEGGIPIVGVPKTIDNDLRGTLFTFGFDSAVACATDALDRLHTTAESHNLVIVLEVMGRYAGWSAIYAGVAGGADVILIPEIPFTYECVCAKIRERE